MTDAFSAMEYPHWLMVAGALLVALGLVGIAFDKRENPEVNITEIATENGRGQSKFQADLARIRADRMKLAEQTKGRWANKAKPPPASAANLDE